MLSPLPESKARLEWLPVGRLTVSQFAQREYKPGWVDYIKANFDPEVIGVLTVNERDGVYYVVDGQHRKLAVEDMWGESEKVQCRIYSGLSEQQEAELFLRINSVLSVSSYAKFMVGVTAGRLAECEIAATVQRKGLTVTTTSGPGTIRATQTLRIIYRRGGAELVDQTLDVILNSYGESALDAPILNGISAVLHRYAGKVNPERLVERLSSIRNGVGGLLSEAAVLTMSTKKPRWQCVAATTVEVYNRGTRSGRLAPWWRMSEDKAKDRVSKADTAA